MNNLYIFEKKKSHKQYLVAYYVKIFFQESCDVFQKFI